MKRTTLVIILLAILVASFLVFTACGEPEHTCSFGEWTVIEKATCTEAGLKVRVCECGESQTEIIPAGHSYTFVVKAPTCTEQGFTTHTCHCGDSYVDAYVDALGHDEIEHVAQAPTCTEVGWDAYVTCSRCDYSTYSEISTDHNFQQSDTCENCGQNIADVAVDCFDMSATEEDNIKCYVIPRPDDKCDAYIKGTGAMEDYYYNGSKYNFPFFQKSYTIAAAYISNGVTTIGNWTFCYCDSLTSITIPDSVTSIGPYAFGGCSSLTSITIPDSVTSIGLQAFALCENLTSITIPDSVTSIGLKAFYGCTSLTYNVYDNGKYLGNESNPYLVLVKATSTSITSCEINENCRFIYEDAFYDCDSLTSIVIPDSVTDIGSYAFCYCFRLTSIVISDRVTDIGDYAFRGCSRLTSVTIGDSVTTIGSYAFDSCTSLTSITIPDSVTTIGEMTFFSCDSLTDVYYIGTEEQWNNITIGRFNSDLTSATIHFNYTGEEN